MSDLMVNSGSTLDFYYCSLLNSTNGIFINTRHIVLSSTEDSWFQPCGSLVNTTLCIEPKGP